MAKGFCVTRDGPKICWVTRDCTQIISVMRTGHHNMRRDLLFLQARDA